MNQAEQLKLMARSLAIPKSAIAPHIEEANKRALQMESWISELECDRNNFDFHVGNQVQVKGSDKLQSITARGFNQYGIHLYQLDGGAIVPQSDLERIKPGVIRLFVVPMPVIEDTDVLGVAIDEEGKTIAIHICSNVGFARSDLQREPKQQKYRDRYPHGFEIVWLGVGAPSDWVEGEPEMVNEWGGSDR